MLRAFFCLLGCCICFYSNSEDEIDLFELSLEDLVKVEIATKQKQTIYASPSSVYVISRQQIKSMGIQNLQNLLNFIPGFQSTRDIEQGTANRISARGRSTALSESVLVHINGRKINDLYTGGISILNRMLDIGNIEHIEVIRGPGSALYGSNAFLGVINIVTITENNELNISVNDNERLASSITTSTRWWQSHQLDFYLSWFDDQGDDYKITDLYGITARVKDPIKGTDAYLKYSFENWQLSGRFMQRELEDFLALGSIGNSVNNEKTEQWSFAIEKKGKLLEQLNYDVSFLHSEDKWQTIALLIPSDVEIEPGFSLTNDFIGGPYLTSLTNNASLNLSYQVDDSHFFSFGASFEKARITDVYTSTTHDLFTLEEYRNPVKLTKEQSFNVEESREVASFYIQEQWHISDNWELTAGLRFDSYNDFGSSRSPRLALVYKPKEKSSLKFMYGTAFRAPNFLELYDRNNYVDFGNVNLNAEEVKTLEVSWLQTEKNWHFEITAFRNVFEQLIILSEPVEAPENPFFAPSFSNIDGQESSGIETEMLYKLNNQFSVRLLWNWFTPNSDINVSRNSGAIVVDFRKDKLNVNLHSYFRSRNKAVANQGSYFVTSTNIIYQFSPELKMNFKLSNMLDKSYRTQSIMYEAGVENRGREITLGMEFLF